MWAGVRGLGDVGGSERAGVARTDCLVLATGR